MQMARIRLVKSRRLLGFTLIELVVVMAVLGLLASLSAPAMQRLVTAQRLRAAGYDLVADLTLARSEALKRGAQVRLSPSASGWLGGWTVQTVSDANVLSQRNALGSGIALSTAPVSVTFDINGRVEASDVVRFGFADSYGRARCILLDPSGRPRSNTTACS